MRFIMAFIGGLAITTALLLVGISLFDEPPSKASLRHGVTVEPLPPGAAVDVAEWLEETRGDLPQRVDGEPVARLPPPPPVAFARADIRGFVQVRFTVLPDGRASDVRVFGAAPEGYFEDEAVAQVRARRWQPALDDDGEPVAREVTEVVEFTVPADAPRRSDG
jgi:TonB family protein